MRFFGSYSKVTGFSSPDLASFYQNQDIIVSYKMPYHYMFLMLCFYNFNTVRHFK